MTPNVKNVSHNYINTGAKNSTRPVKHPQNLNEIRLPQLNELDKNRQDRHMCLPS